MKLSYEDKENIYKRYKHGGAFKDIAKDYNIRIKKVKKIIEDVMNEDCVPSQRRITLE